MATISVTAFSSNDSCRRCGPTALSARHSFAFSLTNPLTLAVFRPTRLVATLNRWCARVLKAFIHYLAAVNLAKQGTQLKLGFQATCSSKAFREH